MFTSTDIRQKGVTDFLTAYQQNCALNGSIPIKPILNGIGGTALFIDISKVKFLLTKKIQNGSPIQNSDSSSRLATVLTVDQ